MSFKEKWGITIFVALIMMTLSFSSLDLPIISKENEVVQASNIVSEKILVFENNTEGSSCAIEIPRNISFLSRVHEINLLHGYFLIGSNNSYVVNNNTVSASYIPGNIFAQRFYYNSSTTLVLRMLNVRMYIRYLSGRTFVQFTVYKILPERKTPMFMGKLELEKGSYDTYFNISLTPLEGSQNQLFPGETYEIECVKVEGGTVGWYASYSPKNWMSLVNNASIPDDSNRD
ncbi:MAG: hypothetical protein QXL15_04955, partial [Candidatus Korarchaeota archaeon]